MDVTVPVARLLIKNPIATDVLEDVGQQLNQDAGDRLRAGSQKLLARQRNTHAPAVAPVCIVGRTHSVLHPAVEPVFKQLLQAELSDGRQETDIIAPYGSPDSELMVMLHFPTEIASTNMYAPREYDTLWTLLCKMGIEDLGASSGAKDHVVF